MTAHNGNPDREARRRDAQPPIDEESLRHPLEMRFFIFSVIVNAGLLILAIYLATHAPTWLESHPIVAENLKQVRALATGMALAPFALTFLRNARRSYVRGYSVALSREQMPEIYGILERHCAKIGLATPPGLFLTEKGISEISTAITARGKDFIVLGTKVVEPNFDKVREVLNFTIARELGRIRLGHTKWFDELLVAYVVRIPGLRDPLEKVRVMSLDRYAAKLVPDGLPGLIVLASGRLMLHNVNIADYLAQLDTYQGKRAWRWIADLGKKEVPVMLRANALYKAGLFNREADLHRFAAVTPVKGWTVEPRVAVEQSVSKSATTAAIGATPAQSDATTSF